MFDQHELLALLRRSIKHGDLVALRRSEGNLGGEVNATVEQRRLVKKIESRTDRRLNYAGRTYKLVADVDLAKLPDRNSYEVVRQRDAAAVLDALAKQSGTAVDLVALLTEARTKLTVDWRPPLRPEGLILLSKIISYQAISISPEPAYSPSQLKQLYEPTGIIEIELIDTENHPVAGESWELLLPDGKKRSGELDEKGYALITSVPDGSCQVTFPRLDADAWALSSPPEK